MLDFGVNMGLFWQASSGLALTEQVMEGVSAKSLAELRQVPALNLTDWPDAAYYCKIQ